MSDESGRWLTEKEKRNADQTWTGHWSVLFVRQASGVCQAGQWCLLTGQCCPVWPADSLQAVLELFVCQFGQLCWQVGPCLTWQVGHAGWAQFSSQGPGLALASLTIAIVRVKEGQPCDSLHSADWGGVLGCCPPTKSGPLVGRNKSAKSAGPGGVTGADLIVGGHYRVLTFPPPWIANPLG